VEDSTVDENDPPWDADPLWYDRAEPGPPPSPLLEGLAWLFLLVLAGCVVLLWTYRLPDHLWCAAAARIRRRRAADAERF
jgi:hypothetical protein